jgi:flagella basal body P-ring formation protein FlgA
VETLDGFPMANRWLESIEQVAGRAVRHSVPAGRPIDRALLAEPNQIERGQAAVAEFDNGGVALRVEVIAESAGRRGDTIVVRNRESGRKLAARIEQNGSLRVLAAGTPRRAPAAARETP